MAEAKDAAVDSGNNITLYVLPEEHPSQAKLAPRNREAVRVRAAGAEPVPNSDHWRMSADQDGARVLKRKSGPREAMRRFGGAMAPERYDRGDWRHLVAVAAADEVEARGETPARRVPREVPDEAERTYFFSAPGEGEHSHAALEKAAAANEVPLLIDRDPDSGYRGLRYTAAAYNGELDTFRTEEARRAWQDSERRRNMIHDVANTEHASPANMRVTPIALPDPNKVEAAHFGEAVDNVRRLDSAKLGALVSATRDRVAMLEARQDEHVAQGVDLPSEQQRLFGAYHRGLRVGESVLGERRATDYRREPNAQAAAEPAARRAVGRRGLRGSDMME